MSDDPPKEGLEIASADIDSPKTTSLIAKVVDGMSSIRGSPRELYLAYILKFLEAYAYFSLSIIFTLFLSEDFGFSDIEAGILYGTWGALISVYGLVVGVLVDNLGVAKSLKVGFVISLVARLGIFFTTSRAWLIFHLCVTLPMGNFFGIPVLATGIRRYTNETNRGFAFGLFYVVQNLAGLVAGPIVDMYTIWFKDDGLEQSNNQGTNEWSLTSYRAIILTGIVANGLALLISFFLREIKVDSNPNSVASSSVSTFRPTPGSFSDILQEVKQSKNFRRFLVVCLVTLNVRMIFRHLDATFPKYMIREFGEDVPKGTIYSINPALIIILVPIITAATTKTNPLTMIHIGTYITAVSVFFLVVSTSIWACIMFIVMLSIGEAIWSPRLYDYTMSICKEGREGTYMAFASAPLFLAKLPVGFLSGYLLEKYCPEEGDRDSQKMWLIIGLLTISSPVLLTLLWGYVSKTDDEELSEPAEQEELKPVEEEEIRKTELSSVV
jgi:dipeptide/tripeptide permease